MFIPPQPDLRCVAVDESGGVDLFFSFPSGVVDTNIKYDIYFFKTAVRSLPVDRQYLLS